MANKTLEEIELKRQEIERNLLGVMSKELAKWQRETSLCISDVNIRLASADSLGGPRQNIVTSISVELDR